MKLQQWFFSHIDLRVSARPSRVALLSNTFRSLSSSRDEPLVFTKRTNKYRPLEYLQDARIEVFRKRYFQPELPILFPRGHFRDLPAFERWFQPPPSSDRTTTQLNIKYLEENASDALVPLELTQLSSEPPAPSKPLSETEPNELGFRQFHAPLTLFLEWMRAAAESQPQSARLYLAQCQLLDLPSVLREDFPTPEVVLQAGKGDVYDTNVWIGHPPTYTPLHRDPNPNLFVQLAGRKVVRLLPPDAGQREFALVRRRLGRSGNREAAVFRGAEMMRGQERALLEQAVWDDVDEGDTGTRPNGGYEAQLEAGDGLFIPKGWWHSIKGVGEGVTASVNWWFR